MRKTYYKKQNNLWKILFSITIIILLLSGIGLLYNHFEDDLQFLGKDEIQVIEGIEDEFKESEIGSSTSVNKEFSSFVYCDLNLYENTRLTKIGVPIKTLTDCTKDQVFTLYVVEGDGTKAFTEIEKYELIIEADTYESNTVNKWHYFDVKDLKIEVGEGQTLAFGCSSDTINFGYKKTTGDRIFYYKCFKNECGKVSDESIYFDVYGYKVEK